MIFNMVRNLKMTQNVTAYNPISSYFQQYTINCTESYEQDMYSSFNMYLNFSFRNFALLYSGVAAGAGGAASKFLPGAGAA
jgi:hypothetical protein